MQHDLRSVGAGLSGKLHEISGLYGMESFVALAKSEKKDVAFTVSTKARVSSAIVQRRLGVYKDSLPLKGFEVVDGRIPLHRRHAISEEISSAKPCCSGRLWAYFKDQGFTSEAVSCEKWNRALFAHVRVVDSMFIIAFLERMNRRTKTVLTMPCMKVENMCAESLLKEVSIAHDTSGQASVDRFMQAGMSDVLALPSVQVPPKPKEACRISKFM